MGNQGTKDWKLTAFFAISLMLIAGLFGNAAIAADGDGTITVGWARSGGIAPDDSYAESPVTPPLRAGSTGNILKFTYTANGVNMNGGSVRIIPIPSGWKVPAAGVQVKDGANRLFLVGTPLSSDLIAITDGTADGPVQLAVGETIDSDLKDQRRVTFTRDGDYITAIEVKLDSENWDTNGTQLQITFIDTTVPIPDRLVYPDNDTTVQPYAEYRFITESKTRRGRFTQLNPTSEVLDPQPRVRVGNIEASVAGTVKITPEIAYEGKEYTFTITFKALGPIYDWGTNTTDNIVVGVQGGVTLPAMSPDNVSFSTTGPVRFETTPIAVTTNSITINISQINKGNEVRISYGPVTIGASTSATADIPDRSAFTVSLSSDITGGQTQALAGSGTMRFTDPSNARVEVGAEGKTLKIRYRADIALPDPVTLEITVAGIDTSLDGENEGPGYVTGSGGSSTNRTLSVIGNTITWTWLDDGTDANVSPFTRPGATFTTTIQNVDIQDDSAEVTWVTRINDTPLTNPPALYIMNPVDNAVEFTSNARSSYNAAEEVVDPIIFTFTAEDTIINDGRVEVRGIPSSWSPLPNSKGPAGKTTVTKYNNTNTPFDITEGIRYGRTVSVDGLDLETDDRVEITYANFTMQSQATPADRPVKITGHFRPSPSGSLLSAGTEEIDVTQVQDGYGEATIKATAANAPTVKAGSNNNQIIVEFTAVGTMDSGAVSLEKPTGWGDFQDDDAKQANYVEVRVVGGRGKLEQPVNVTADIVVAHLETFAPNAKLRFTYGNAEVQSDIGHAEFRIQSNGGGDRSFAYVRGTERTAAEQEETPEPFGAVYRDDPDGPGILRVEVTGADDGSGSAEVTIEDTQQGEAEYPDNVEERRIHAGDTGTYLLFTYTPTETIENGQLKFQTNGEWSNPSNSSGTPGYTEIDGTGSARLGDVDFDENDNSVTVDIDEIEPDDTIEIHYGVYSGTDDGSGAHAPTSTATSSPFTISIKGGDATTNQLKAIKTPVTVRVYSQASGGGNASASVSDNKGDVGAGDADRQVTVVYTAAGQISGGSLKLTVPLGWSHPTADNVEITSRGSVNSSSALFDGMDVTVGGVSLSAGGTVTFVYSAAMAQPTAGSAKFNVAVDGGSGPGEGPMPVTPDPSDATTIAVGDASPGSGSGEVVLQQAIVAGEGGHTLTFIYTAAGAITDRALDIRVNVPTGWSEPTDRTDAGARGSFTVTHRRLTNGTLVEQTAAAAAVEKIGPFDRQMAARLKQGSSLAAGDQVVFTYENADAPATVGPSTFTMLYGGVQVKDADLTVIVGSGKPATAIALTAPATHLIESTTPAAISVQLQDEDGSEVPAEVDTVVSLSSSSATGRFTVDGAAATSVTIAAGTTTATAAYTDSTEDDAVITASSGTLTADTATITVTTRNVMITSASSSIADSDGVAKTVARDGDTVTVTARANPNRTVTVMIETIFAAAVNMDESPAGTYTRSYTLAAGTQDGTYDITVALGALSESAGSVAIDNTPPTISATSASPATVANGDTVTISATIAGATSVTANVSAVDTAATASVNLTDFDVAGTYTGTHPISINNAAANGAHAITITATDAAGNSSSDSTATVTLQNSISFTSTLPQGISLFHVPLDEEGLDTVGDLETKLGDSVNLLITYDGTSWNSRSSDVAITASLGILVSLSAETTVTFEGQAWADTTVTLAAGSNLIGLPVSDARVTNISGIAGLFAAGSVTSVIVSSGGEFQLVAAAGDPADGPVAGDAAYLVMASAAGSATLSGDGWQNGTVGAAPIALAGYRVDNQTPVLDVLGSVIDEITGVSQEGYRVKVKNLSTKASLSNITSEVASGYNMTFVDLADNYAARVGDVLEISADSPSPLIGVQPVRHIVTVDDVKNGSIQLEDLIAYEIPAETELLRNFPNPFNPETWIPYHLSEDAEVKLTIYDVNGEMVRDIDVGHQTAAKYDTRAKAIYWDGRNRFGEQVASGIYFYSLSAGDFSGTRKMVILK